MANRAEVAARRRIHFALLGYQPLRMKPVHFATNFFNSVCGHYYPLDLFNKALVVKFGESTDDEYVTVNLRRRLLEAGIIHPSMSEAQLALLRNQINAVYDNDGSAVHACFKPYTTFGNDYTLSSTRMLSGESKNHGYSGYFVHQVLSVTTAGKAVIGFAKDLIARLDTPTEHLAAPLLDPPEYRMEWKNPYPNLFGDLTVERLKAVADLMQAQTEAIACLCRNLADGSPVLALRSLVIGLCAWLFLYLHRLAANGNTPLLFMDFQNGSNRRTRSQSQIAYASYRDRVAQSYTKRQEASDLAVNDQVFALRDTKDLREIEQHYSDLAIRIGFCQPRAQQVRQKHFELQPDTLKVLMMGLLHAHEVATLETAATRLRAVFGLCAGVCHDDQARLRDSGFQPLDEDQDLEPNREAFKDLLLRMQVASEPSDGLVLCSVNADLLP